MAQGQIKATVTTSYTALASSRLIAGRAEISCRTDNVGDVTFRMNGASGDNNDEVDWQAGEYHTLESVDLNQIEIKGTASDIVTVVMSDAVVG